MPLFLLLSCFKNVSEFPIRFWLFTVIQTLQNWIVLLKHVVFPNTPGFGGLPVCAQEPGGELSQ